MISLVAKSLSEPCVSLVNIWFVKIQGKLLSIFCHLSKHLDAGGKVDSSINLRKLETSIQKLPVIMKCLLCIPLGNRAVVKSLAAPSPVPAHSQVGQRTGPAEKEPSKKVVFRLEQYLGLAHGAATHTYVVPHSPVGMRMCLGRMGCLGRFSQHSHLHCKCRLILI